MKRYAPKRMAHDTTITRAVIGRTVRVVKASEPGVEGLHGIIVDETKTTITIDGAAGDGKACRRRVPKKAVTLCVSMPDTSLGEHGGRPRMRDVVIDGASLIGRPDERIKKAVR